MHSIHLGLRITVESEAAQEPQDSKQAAVTAQGSLFESDIHSIGKGGRPIAVPLNGLHAAALSRTLIRGYNEGVVLPGVQIVMPSNLKGVA